MRSNTVRILLVLAMGILTAIIGLLAWQNYDQTELSDASFLDKATSSGESVDPVPLVPVEDETFSQNAPVIINVSYTPERISLSGTVNSEPLAEALLLASEQLVPDGDISEDLELLTGAEMAVVQLVISGEVIDDEERYRVLTKFLSLGVNVTDQMIIRGSDRTVFEVIRDTPELSQVYDFFEAAGSLEDLLPQGQTFTIFAPSNTAVEALDIAALQEFAELVQLNEILQFHVVLETFDFEDLEQGMRLGTLQGEKLTIAQLEDGSTTVSGGTVLTSDIEGIDGIIHVIDTVLIPGTIQTEIELNQIVYFDPILFAVGSPYLADSSQPILEEIAEILINNPEGNLEIQGHTDTDGGEEVNLTLSQDRADTVREFLIAQGVEPERISAVGYGETILKVDPEETAEDRAANRRIEFRIN
ncbi:MAG: fasciclin domain-containing protein [Actinomycetota bacterium]|nr:fasciclin domain-containing protein [Actinomycetota bacterium]